MRARAIAIRTIAVVLALAAIAWAWPRYKAVWVGGDSMAPALHRGDLVVVRRGGAGARPGDIVLVDKTGWPAGILHRVETVYADGSMILRGDANPVPDASAVPASRLKGVTIAVVPFGRAIASAERLVRRWYNAASHSAYRGEDGEAATLPAPSLQREARLSRWEGLGRAGDRRFTPPAAGLKVRPPGRRFHC